MLSSNLEEKKKKTEVSELADQRVIYAVSRNITDCKHEIKLV